MGIVFNNGYLYKIELVYSDCMYGNKRLYNIITEEPTESVARKVILDLLNTSKKPSKGNYDIKRDKREFSIYDYLKGYYTLKYNEQKSLYEYYEEGGYDD